MSHFIYSDEEHRYAIMPGSRRVPSVTQVLEHVGMSPDFSFLDGYYLERGRAIHSALALELQGRLDWDSLDDRVRPFVERGCNWLDAIDAKPLVVEFRWVHRTLEYGGTLDVFADSKLGPILVDWKAVIFDRCYEVQVAGGYEPMLIDGAAAGAVPVEPEVVREARIAVVTLGNEMPKAHWVPRADHAAVFQAALAVSQWRTAHKR